MKIKLILIALSVSIITSCSTQKSQTTSTNTGNMNTSKIIKSQTIKLKKGELFLAVIGHQMEGKETLLQEYFGIVFPPAQKNGFMPLGQLPIDEVATGNFIPNEFVGLFKWPGMTNVQAFMGEVSPEKLTKLRVQIWSELKQHMVMVSEDMEMTFKENKIYEVKMLWNKQMLDSMSITNSGGKILVNSPVAGYEDLGKNEAPNNLIIIEWDDKESAESFKKMNLLKVKKQESFYTHFAFPEVK